MSFAGGCTRLFPVRQLFRRFVLGRRVHSRLCAPPMRSLYDVDGRVGQELVLAGVASYIAKLVADHTTCVCYGIWKTAGQVEYLCFGGPKIVWDNVEDPIWIKGTVIGCRRRWVVVSATLLDWLWHYLLMVDGFCTRTKDILLTSISRASFWSCYRRRPAVFLSSGRSWSSVTLQRAGLRSCCSTRLASAS